MSINNIPTASQKIWKNILSLPLNSNISANFRKNSKWSEWNTYGPGGNASRIKPEVKKISCQTPFKERSCGGRFLKRLRGHFVEPLVSLQRQLWKRYQGESINIVVVIQKYQLYNFMVKLFFFNDILKDLFFLKFFIFRLIIVILLATHSWNY